MLIDTAVLATLPEREYRAGLAEVVKYGVILDEEFFSYLEANVAGLRARQDDVLRHVVGAAASSKPMSFRPTSAKRRGSAPCSITAIRSVTRSRH